MPRQKTNDTANRMMLFSSPIPLEPDDKNRIVPQRNYHSKQSSTRVDRNCAVVSQHKGKVYIC